MQSAEMVLDENFINLKKFAPTPKEFEIFIREVKEMYDKEKTIDLGKAIHNAIYFAEIDRRLKNVEERKNLVTFTKNEWEKFTNENFNREIINVA